MSESTGIILNDQMDVFSYKSRDGFPASQSNSIRPGKRPLSSMSPLIVTRDNDIYLTLGGSGGPTIISKVLQVTPAVRSIA